MKMLYFSPACVCSEFLQMGIRFFRKDWVPWFWCSCFKTLTPGPHRRSPLTCCDMLHTVGQADVKLSPPWLYYLREFREGAPTRLSERVQSFICDRQGLSAPRRLPFKTLNINTAGMAGDVYRHVRPCEVVVFKYKLSCSRKSVYTYSNIYLVRPRGTCRTEGYFCNCQGSLNYRVTGMDK